MAIISGSVGDDILNGTPDADQISGGAGNDTINGGDGNDYIDPGLGDDVVHGGGGDDYIGDNGMATSGGHDAYYGDDGNDTLTSMAQGTGGVLLDGGAGNDTISAIVGSNPVTAIGGDGDDSISIQGFGDQTIDAGAGDDQVFLGSGHSYLVTLGAGADHLTLSSNYAPAIATIVNDYVPGTDTLTFAFAQFLTGWSGSGNPFGSGYARLLQQGADTVLQIDGDGGGNSYADFIRFKNVAASDFSAADFGGYAPPGQTEIGTTGADTLIGGGGDDLLNGLDGNDQLRGKAGDDTLVGGLGNDELDGGNGTDTADYSAAQQAVTVNLNDGTASGADAGSDNLSSIEHITGGAGGDLVYGDGQDNAVFGNGGNDTIFAGDGHDTLFGDDGDDTLVGNANQFAQESDVLSGGAGNDTIVGEFTDTIDGGAGTDVLYAANAFDWTINLGITSIEVMQAGFGSDTIDASTQTAGVTVFGSGGADVVTGSGFADFLWGGIDNDTLNGGGGNDVIVGEGGADSMSGGEGDDQIYTDGGDTLIDGGNGTDVLYVGSGSGITLNLANSHFEWVIDSAGGNDTLNGAALSADMVAFAGGGTDVITGGAGFDFLWGQAGNDTISGGANGDTLVGGSESDTLNGGAGMDTLFMSSGGGGDLAVDTAVYNAPGWGTDFIYDFEHLTDKINMQGSGATLGTLSITNVGGHAYVSFGGADLIVVVNQGATLTAADFVF